jgi:hypothetical protein
MNTLKLVDELVRAVNSGYNSSDKKVDDNYIFEMLPQWRAQVMILTYNGGKLQGSNTIIKGNKLIPASWKQEVTYTINLLSQDPTLDYLTVEGLPIVSLNEYNDGIQYFGTKSIANGFFYARSLNEIQQFKDLRLLAKKPAVLIVGNERRIYGNKLLKEVLEVGIYQNPYAAKANFNYATDTFPIGEGDIPLMKEIAIAALRTEFRAIKDVTADAGNEQQAALKNSILG